MSDEPVTSDAPVTTDEPHGSGESPAPRHGVPFGVLVTVGALATAAAVTLIVFLVLALSAASRDHARQDARKDATNAAASGLVAIASYNYATIDADRKKAEAVLVPAQRAKYDKLFQTLSESVQQRKPVVKAVVDEAQPITADSATQVRVLVFFEQTATVEGSTSPKITPYTFALVMQKLGGRWLIADAEPIV